MATNVNKTILILEDDASLRDILVEKFTSEGFSVISAPDGQVGLEKFSQNAIDVVLLDLYMPVMDGHAFLTKLREDPKGASLPVVVLSNMVDHDYVVGAFDKRIVDYLLKTNTGLDIVVEKVKKAAGVK